MSREIKIAGLTIPVPKWATTVFGLLAVLYVAYFLFNQPVQTVYSRYLSGKAEESDAAEAYKHFTEWPKSSVKQDVAGGTFEAKLFQDGCVSVAYQNALTGIPPRPHFIRNVTRDLSASETAHPVLGVLDLRSIFGPQVLLAAAQPGCINPHAGEFTWKYGDRNGCLVQVWRYFADGCVHFQWFDSCSNSWDVNKDGSPRIQWTECRHK